MPARRQAATCCWSSPSVQSLVVTICTVKPSVQSRHLYSHSICTYSHWSSPFVTPAVGRHHLYSHWSSLSVQSHLLLVVTICTVTASVQSHHLYSHTICTVTPSVQSLVVTICTPYWSPPPRAGSRGHPAGTPLLLREGVPPAGCLRGACGGRRYPPVTGALCAGSAG